MERGPGLDALPADGGGDPLVVVGDLERPEAVVADVQRLGGEGTLTFTTTQPSDEIDHRSSSSIGHWHQVLRSALVAATSTGPSLSRSG